jgi:hypothetical protein
LLLAVWIEPVTTVAASFDVSDKAIEKRCKRLGVAKPPRGYWAKIQNGIPHEHALITLGWKKEKVEKLGESLAVAEDSVRARDGSILIPPLCTRHGHKLRFLPSKNRSLRPRKVYVLGFLQSPL